MTGITVALYMFVAGIVCEFSSTQLLRMGNASREMLEEHDE
ncbi:hypothetical protein [Yersinia pseudotuberculosis]|nr:hypothetical protein [Yersinia pseudotuberculosis]CNC89270.1 Uncharacterised protein [Yersinia pseudotuberculosis]